MLIKLGAVFTKYLECMSCKDQNYKTPWFSILARRGKILHN